MPMDRAMRFFLQFLWIFVAIGAAIGVVFVVMALDASSNAMARTTAAAIGVAFAVIPYIFVRAVEGMAGPQKGPPAT
jgi:quinol-cytochrome oxidoreductase complex cytochrome b subunit